MVVHVKSMAHETSPIVIVCGIPHSRIERDIEGPRMGKYLPNKSVYCSQIQWEKRERRAAQHRGYSISENPHDINLGQELLITAERTGECGRWKRSTFWFG